jgi:tetratricopeptide (TPR) repeat protein
MPAPAGQLLLLAAAACVLHLPPNHAAQPKPQPQRWMHDREASYSQGVELYQRGRSSRLQRDLTSAVRLLRRALVLGRSSSSSLGPADVPPPASQQQQQQRQQTHANAAEEAATEFYLGASLGLLGRNSEAITAYQRCIELGAAASSRLGAGGGRGHGGGRASAWHNLGAIHERQLEWGAAAAAYARSASLRLLRVHTQQRSSVVESQRRRAVEAMAELGSWGKALFHSGRPAEGTLAFSRALRLAERARVGWRPEAELRYLLGRSLELYG